MMDYVDANADFSEIFKRFDELSSQPLTVESANELSDLVLAAWYLERNR